MHIRIVGHATGMAGHGAGISGHVRRNMQLAGLQPRPPGVKSMQMMELGDVDGVPLSLTDGTALHAGAWAFSAVAESTDNSYHDGACVGSAIGIVAPDGELRRLHLLAGAPKVEGLAAQALGSDWVFTLVTDPDDPKTPSHMLQTRMALDLEGCDSN